jgi:aminoglycoside phosphotransferase (APT) family kinase protein
MATGAMPPAEVDLGVAQVAALVARQMPRFADVEVAPFAHGWDNILFRLGADWLGRFPRREVTVALVRNEARWLPGLAPRLPLAIPVPVLLGQPGEGYPWPWTIVPWVEGVPAAEKPDLDLARAASQLGNFLSVLHHPAPEDAPANPFRGVPLEERDRATRERTAQLESVIDSERVTVSWEEALAAPAYQEHPVWLHGDLHPGNVIVEGGGIAGVVDFGDLTSGDPATDLSAMWTVLGGEHLDRFEVAYGGIDGTTWRRARGWALSLGLAYLASSGDNPTMEAIGRRTLEAVLATV